MKKYSLVGIDGNAFCLMGYTSKCMKHTGFSKEEIDKVMDDAKSSDYNHLIVVLDDAIQACNKKIEESPDFDGWEEDDDEDEDW